MIDIIKEVKEIESNIISWRRDLHRTPELGLELPQTSAYIKSRLDEMGIDYETMVNGNAIVAHIMNDKGGKTIAIRADMDGLPIKEETGLEFASTNGCMHACGHDAHTSDLDVLKHSRDLFFLKFPGHQYPLLK